METVLNELYNIILDRIKKMPEGSYTAQLVSRGLGYIAQKFGEEAVEVIVAALSEDRGRFIEEVADLIYHLLVLMAIKNVSPNDIVLELRRRRK